jgi:uncharacterized phiE125 gp8 family phage protein
VPITWNYVTPPAAEPVTLTEAKLHLREDGTDQDSLIEGLITAAREYVESTGRLLMPCVVRQYFDCFPEGDYLRLSPLPIRSIASVGYLDSDGDTQAITDYTADVVSEPARLQEPETGWPVTDDVVNAAWVDINAGYTSASAVPRALKQAILLLVGHWYENRESVVVGTTTAELPLAVETLMRRWAVYTQ